MYASAAITSRARTWIFSAMLYLHFPFCRRACSYCDFHFSVNHREMDEVMEAMIMEMEIRKDELPAKILDSIYFGGGTPSLMNEKQLHRLFEAIARLFQIAPDAEITLEANPDDLTQEKLKLLRATPVNRLSIGVQSFSDQHLQLMNRAHTAAMALQSIHDAAEAGFTNLTMDLIYGVPGMTIEEWRSNLETAFALPVNHLSCYHLTIEKKTLLNKMVSDGKMVPVHEDESLRQFELLMDLAEAHDFDHYEISNFARKGYYSRHNRAYWNGTPYLGIGPSAHSFNGNERRWNVSSNAAYIASLKRNELPSQGEVLTPQNHYNEYIMTGLRTSTGVDRETILERFGEAVLQDFLIQSSRWMEGGELLQEGSHYFLSRRGKLLADRIAAGFFLV